MKKFRKIMAVLVAAIMVVAMTVPAWADTITIQNTAGGSVYNVYQIFDMTYNSGETSFAYTIDSGNPFFAAVQTFASDNDNGLTLQQIGGSTKYNVIIDTTKFTGANPESVPTAANGKAGELAVALKAVADGFNDTAVQNNRVGTATATSDNQELTITVSDHGYYFMTTTTGTVFTLDSNSPNVTVKDKNEKPTIDKTVDEGGTYGDTNDGEIGSIVNYRTIINAKVGAKGYVYHDVMSSGLTYGNDVAVYLENTGYAGADKVTIGSTVYQPITTSGTTWTAAAGAEGSNPCTFEVTFNDTWLSTNITADKGILLTYSATIDSDAVAGTADTNTAWLKYGENNRTQEDVTKTYTWEIDVYKFVEGAETTALQGATFKIVNSNKSKVATITNGKLAGWTTIGNGESADNLNITTGTDLTTPASGKISVQGFDAGTYYLVETAAPAGYKRLAAPITVTITSTESTGTRSASVTDAATISGSEDTILYIKVPNKAGVELPSTGGMGTTVLYIVGGMLIVLAGAYLFFSRKRTA